MTESWVEMEGAEAFLKQLKMQRQAQLENLIGCAKSSTDPSVVRSWAAYEALKTVIQDMEAERGSSDE